MYVEQVVLLFRPYVGGESYNLLEDCQYDPPYWVSVFLLHVLLFNGISILLGLFNANSILLEKQ